MRVLASAVEMGELEVVDWANSREDLVTLDFNAPLKEIATPLVPENPVAVLNVLTFETAEMSGTHQRLFQRKYMKPLLLALMIGAFNQLDGINAVIYYRTHG